MPLLHIRQDLSIEVEDVVVLSNKVVQRYVSMNLIEVADGCSELAMQMCGVHCDVHLPGLYMMAPGVLLSLSSQGESGGVDMIGLPFKSNRFLSFLSSMAPEKYGINRPAYDSPAKKIRWSSIPKIFSKFCKNPRKSSARSCSPRAVISPTENPEPTGLSIHLDGVHFGKLGRLVLIQV